jgi:hypothetical protein
LTFAQPLQSDADEYQENIIISEYPSEGKTLDELWNSMVLRDFPRSFENFKFKQMWDSKIGQYDAKWIEFSNKAHGLVFCNLVYMLVENDKMYYILCTAEEKEFDQVEKDFNIMINSLQLN